MSRVGEDKIMPRRPPKRKKMMKEVVNIREGVEGKVGER